MSDFYDSLEEGKAKQEVKAKKQVTIQNYDSTSDEETTVPYYTGESELGTILREGMQYKIPHRTIFTQSQSDDYSRPMSSQASTSSVCSFDVDSINEEMMNDETDEPSHNVTQRVKVMKKRKPKNSLKQKLSYLQRFRLNTGLGKDDSSSHPESGDTLLSYNPEKDKGSDSEESFYRELMKSDQEHLQSSINVKVESLPDISESNVSHSMPDITTRKYSPSGIITFPKPKSSGYNRFPAIVKQPKPDPHSASLERLRRQREYALAANSRNRLNFVKKKALKMVEKEAENLKMNSLLIDEEREKKLSSLVTGEDQVKPNPTTQLSAIAEKKPPLAKKKERKSYLTTFAKQSVAAEAMDEAALKRMAERHEEDAKMAEMIRREMVLQSPDDPFVAQLGL